jgi:hypothetical protein
MMGMQRRRGREPRRAASSAHSGADSGAAREGASTARPRPHPRGHRKPKPSPRTTLPTTMTTTTTMLTTTMLTTTTTMLMMTIPSRSPLQSGRPSGRTRCLSCGPAAVPRWAAADDDAADDDDVDGDAGDPPPLADATACVGAAEPAIMTNARTRPWTRMLSWMRMRENWCRPHRGSGTGAAILPTSATLRTWSRNQSRSRRLRGCEACAEQWGPRCASRPRGGARVHPRHRHRRRHACHCRHDYHSSHHRRRRRRRRRHHVGSGRPAAPSETSVAPGSS